MLIGKQPRVTAIDQRRVIRLPALNGRAKVIYQRFTHQVFREVTPCLAAIGHINACQNTQPRLVAFRLEIAEIAPGMNCIRLHVDIMSINLQTTFIVLPGEGRHPFFYFQRRTENGGIRHFRLFHVERYTPMFNATG